MIHIRSCKHVPTEASRLGRGQHGSMNINGVCPSVALRRCHLIDAFSPVTPQLSPAGKSSPCVRPSVTLYRPPLSL